MILRSSVGKMSAQLLVLFIILGTYEVGIGDPVSTPCSGGGAKEYILPPDDVDLIGEITYVTVKPGETLFDIALTMISVAMQLRRLIQG